MRPSRSRATPSCTAASLQSPPEDSSIGSCRPRLDCSASPTNDTSESHLRPYSTHASIKDVATQDLLLLVLCAMETKGSPLWGRAARELSVVEAVFHGHVRTRGELA